MLVSVCGRARPQPLSYYGVSVLLRFAAFAALLIPVILAPALSGQTTATPSPEPTASAPAAKVLQPDELDSTVIRAREVLAQVQRLVGTGALPPIRLRKAQQD